MIKTQKLYMNLDKNQFLSPPILKTKFTHFSCFIRHF